MSIGTSKKILKIFGILGIIMGILALAGGVLALFGGGVAGMKLNPETVTDQEAGVVALLFGGGIIFLITGFISLIEGIFSVRAAKDSSKIMPAWIFAILGLISGVVSLVSSFKADLPTIVGGVISILINVLIFVAANTIKKSR